MQWEIINYEWHLNDKFKMKWKYLILKWYWNVVLKLYSNNS